MSIGTLARRYARAILSLASEQGQVDEVGKQLGIRQTPTVEFFLDAVPETARQIEDLLDKARRSDEAVAEQASGAAYAGDADPYVHPREDESDESD